LKVVVIIVLVLGELRSRLTLLIALWTMWTIRTLTLCALGGGWSKRSVQSSPKAVWGLLALSGIKLHFHSYCIIGCHPAETVSPSLPYSCMTLVRRQGVATFTRSELPRSLKVTLGPSGFSPQVLFLPHWTKVTLHT